MSRAPSTPIIAAINAAGGVPTVLRNPHAVQAVNDVARAMAADALDELLKARAPEWFAFDMATNTVTIDGIKYAREYFSFFATSPLESYFKIIDRKDGAVTVHQISADLADHAPDLLAFAQQIFNGLDTKLLTMDSPDGETLANVLAKGRAAVSAATRRPVNDRTQPSPSNNGVQS